MCDFNAVKMALPMGNYEIWQAISKLREKGESYANIGEKLGLDKAAVYMIFTGRWSPKRQDISDRILAKVKELAQ